MSNSIEGRLAESTAAGGIEGKGTLTAGAAFVDGRIVPVSEANISILDWGFLHSDATYDVVHVWKGRFFRLKDHLDRFARGMRRLRMEIPYDGEEIEAILKKVVLATGLQDAYVEVVCTRGVPPPGSRDPRQCINRFYAFAVPFTWIAAPEQRVKGLKMRISNFHRIAPEAVDPTVKNYHWLDLVSGLFEAYDFGDETAILTDGNGNVVEGPGFNVFAVFGDEIVTPKTGVLEGITRQTVMDIAQASNFKLHQRELTSTELFKATEVFITSTAGGIMPIGWVNGALVGAGGVGNVTAKIQAAYWDLHIDPAFSTPVSA